MKCIQCGGAMRVRRETVPYRAIGLPNITLANVEVRGCPACGEVEYVIPNIEQLHELIARTVATKREKLTPQEVRFLRTWLGWSNEEFATRMDVTPETVSRWQSRTAGQQISGMGERLLRLMVLCLGETRADVDALRDVARLHPRSLKVVLRETPERQWAYA